MSAHRPVVRTQEPPSAELRCVRTVAALRERLAEWRQAGERIAFVPTMGNLHAGHLSLVDGTYALADRVVVSIFVNPTQFGPMEDIATYPRTPEEDQALLTAQRRTDLLFVPSESEIYPHGTADLVGIRLPALADDLCGRVRPGHFDGVASVVLRLLNIVTPDLLIMGQKDFQQTVLLRRMLRELHLPVEIVVVPTVREADGLALSSRNQYLTPSERALAPRLHAALTALASTLDAGARGFDRRRSELLDELARDGFKTDYLELRHADDLSPAGPDAPGRQRVLLIAARLGRARLIDNLLV